MNPSNLFALLQTAAQVAPALVALEEAETNPSLTAAEKKAAVLSAVASLDAKVAPLLNLPAEIVSALENPAALSFAYDLLTEGVALVEQMTGHVPPSEQPAA
jgi:hypothetical protein